MNDFSEKRITTKLTQKIDELYKPITIKEIELVIKCPLLKRQGNPDTFQGSFLESSRNR